MKIVWQIDSKDIKKVQDFFSNYQDDEFVQHRIKVNLSEPKRKVVKDSFWRAMVHCPLTTQQRVGPGSAVDNFSRLEPFPLSYEECIAQTNLQSYAEKTLSDFGGIRRWRKIAEAIAVNMNQLEREGLWGPTLEKLNKLCMNQPISVERETADFIQKHFREFGPKQSRNLLQGQGLGLTRYEIPLDRRVIQWFNNSFDFPVRLSGKPLADRDYYVFVLDGIQQLCEQSGVYPCLLDAAIFVSFNRRG